MVNNVNVLLFDEPLANLDPKTGQTAIELIDDIYRTYKKTVIIIEHRIEDVLHCPVDRIIVVDGGKIACDMNADALINICTAAKCYGAKLIHFSTDYVFDGSSSVPYIETDSTNPQSVYGRTKLQGEQNIVGLLPEHYIIRTAWLYGRNGANFVSTMLRLMNEKDSLKVVNDQRGSPTYAVDLAKAVLRIMQVDNHRYGIYHYSNEGNITWYDFACEIYRQGKRIGLIKRTCSVVPCTSSEFPQKAHRPSFSLLDKQKIKETFSLSVPNWNESLSSYLKELL